MASLEGLIQSWKGEPIDKEKHGGIRATIFINFMVVMTNMAYVPNMLNIVTYVHDYMHTSVAETSNIVTNFVGITSGFSLLGAFISDSYVTRFKTILMFAPLEFLGFGLLAVQAHVQSLRPPPCDNSVESNHCEPVHGYKAIIFYLGLYTIALGEGCVRACLASLGGDQFTDDDPIEKKQKSSFFNWFTFGISLGVFVGVILVVWVENEKGWDKGFGLSALIILVGLVVIAGGFPFYRNLTPSGSPLTRIMKVFVAAYKKRKLPLPETEDMLWKGQIGEQTKNLETLQHTKNFRSLDKAALLHGKTGEWSLCTISQVEETKIVLKLLPIFLSGIISYIPIPLLMSLSIQQGNTMNTKIGSLHISPATLFVIPVIFQMTSIVIYDRFFVPFARKITGYASGITHLQRVGIGFLSIILSTCVAACIESKRLRIVEEHGLVESGDKVPMSVLWLGVQFFILGISDITSFVGLLEFFNSEISTGMKSIGTAIFWCELGLSSLFGTFVVNMVNGATRHVNDGKGWLEGNNLNKSHLDRFYWFLTVIGFLGFLNYLYWARRYVYRQSPLVASI